VIKKLFLLTFFCISIQAVDLSESDKQKHFTLSSLIAIGTNQYLYHNTNLSTQKRIGYTILLSNIPGVVKELHDDRKPNNKFDKEDIQANFLGSLLGVALSESFSYFYFDVSNKKQYLSFKYKF
jgi:uncharacterized protein YfiM (DUF2279 family)